MSVPGRGARRQTGRPTTRLSGWVFAALMVGVVSLGLPWGDVGTAGYTTIARVPVVAAGVLVLLGWRTASQPLVQVGEALGVVALMLAHLVGSGPLALAIALVLLEAGVRRAGWLETPNPENVGLIRH